jgi:O-antigen/teichoic acid export membrane protein
VTVARVAAEGISVAAAVVLAHLVPPAQFGHVAVTMVVSELALALANEGAGSALVQRRVVDRAHVEGTAMLALVAGTALSLITFFLSPLATTPVFGEETTKLFQLLSPAFIITALGIVPLAMLERRLDFRRISIIETATALVGALSSVVLAIAGLEAEAYVLGLVAGLVVWAALLLAFGPTVFPRWRPREMREMARFALPAGLAGTAVVGYGNVDYLILGATLSPAKVGYYYRAYTLGVQYERKISAIITRLAFPVYSRTESLDHMRAVRSRVIRINAAVILPMLALFIALAPQLVPWLFGERWEPAVLPAQILAVAGMARMINNGTPPLMLAAGKPGALLAFNLCRFAVLGVAVLLAAPYGLTVVCITVAAFQVTTVVVSYALMLGRLVGVPLRQLALDIGPAIAATGILLAVSFPLAHALSTSSLPRPATILLVSALGAPLYLLALRLISPAAWADIGVLARRVLLPRGRRKTPVLSLEGSAAPSGK